MKINFHRHQLPVVTALKGGAKVRRNGNESSFALCRLKLEEPMFRKMQDPWALTYSAKKTKDGKNSGIKVISSPESFLSFLRFPSSLILSREEELEYERDTKME